MDGALTRSYYPAIYTGFGATVKGGIELSLVAPSSFRVIFAAGYLVTGESHYSLHAEITDAEAIKTRWANTPGFYSGDASNLDDLVCYWNLRAADIPLFFVDTNHLERYGETISTRGRAMRAAVAQRRFEWARRLAVWTGQDSSDKVI